MKYSLRVGRIFGIDIFIDSSWVVIFILFTWVLGVSYFPNQFSNWPASQYWVVAVFTSILIFASVLVHELAHSLVAQKQGERVRSITLFILGGVAQISEEPKQPLKELVMALVGPMASLMLGLLFFILSLVFRGVSEPLQSSFEYLALINTILAIFNLLPGFPMDGGRILRAILWKSTGNLRKATRIASQIGQGFAFFLIFIGIFQVINGNISGFWLVFIGWFLHSAAVRGYKQVMIDSLLRGIRAEDLMTRNFESVHSTLPVQELADEYILKGKGRVFLVSENERLQGIVCLEDVKEAPREKWPEMTVREIMTPRESLKAVSPNANGRSILRSLTSKDIHQVPVMEGEKVLGIICRSDILRFIQLRSELGDSSESK
ncbi:MAG: site-2 protease family protein [Acidobacteriota bacterium]|nr:site-2 protease family protein [Acidobacteriota bacterium]